jgi:WhiB family redox-sensing transcriptional regulator
MSVLLPCQSSPDLFFAEHPPALASAQRLCAACPMQELCLAEALERGERSGVWGGQILVDGTVVAFKRGRGRPRKDAQPLAS